jgi:hypothetical protein
MIVARGTEHVGSWHFRLNPDDSDEGMTSTSSGWLRALRAMEAICHATARDGLLSFPLQVKVFFGVGPSYPPARVLAVSTEEELRAAMLSLVQSGGDFDWDLEVLAQSSVFSLSGQRWQKDVFGIDCAFTRASITVTAWTRADIWMPYNLMAQPQWSVAELNAPRLRAALEAIERIVGKPGYAEDSRFAKVDGYELRNHIVRGDVLDLQDMGYDESWIVERWPDPDPAPGSAGA